MEKVHVYFHLNAITGKVFYVGIGIKFRPYRKSGRSLFWNRVVNKYGYRVEIIHTFDCWEKAKSAEKYYIKKFGRVDLKTGTLVNLTDGGDGVLGCRNLGRVVSAETRAKQSASLKGRPLHPNVRAGKEGKSYIGLNKGMKRTEETKRRISEAKKGTVISDDHRRKVSEKLKGRVFSEETRRKNSEALKGVAKSAEHRQKLSEATKKYWALKKIAA